MTGFESRHVHDHSLPKCSIQLMDYEKKTQSNIPGLSSIKFDFAVSFKLSFESMKVFCHC